MSHVTSSPSLPTDLVDGLLDGLRRVAAVADLLETVGSCAPPERLLEGTLAGAGDVIGKETARMLALVRSHDRKPSTP
jgi:hypothetical protein